MRAKRDRLNVLFMIDNIRGNISGRVYPATPSY